MYIIGERINGTFSNVNEAIKKKDKSFIQKLAVSQIQKGADSLDISLGPEFKNSTDAMKWLINSVEEAVNTTLCIDSPKFEIIEFALKAAKSPKIINSSTCHDEKLDKYIKLAKEYNSSLIVLTMDETGLPKDLEGRLALAVKAVQCIQDNDFSIDKIYLDPLVMPVNIAQDQAKTVINTIREFQIITSPPVKTIAGLSNISQNTKNRSLINRTFLALLMEAGLNSAILDPMDSDLMDTVKATQILLNKTIYCDSFLKLR